MVFEPGELAAGRFRIERFVARGAMGEIWEASDLELGGRVALKTIRPEIAEDAQAVARFKREIQLARRVTHANVCRLFDLWFHDPPRRSGAPQGRIIFITMEFLEGETLERRLDREGRLRPDEALRIARQMAEGLTAAHEIGIVHRDLKSGNVMLLSSGGSEGGERVVLTDFGLAQDKGLPTREADPEAESSEDNADPSTRHATHARYQGTPAYMAPEQVRGGPITPATDLYSLGMVLFEMVTGRLPWIDGPPLEIARRRLVEPAPSPRTIVPELNPRWEAAILRCLEKDPGLRFASSREVVEAITGTESAARTRTAAVLPFANQTGVPKRAWLSTALGDLLARRLAIGDELSIVGPEVVAEIARDLGHQPAGSLPEKLRQRLGEQFGVGLFLAGEVRNAPAGNPDELLWQLRVEDAATGRTTVGVAEVGNSKSLADLVERASLGLRGALGLDPESPGALGHMRAAYPIIPEAASNFADATVHLRFGNAGEAREAFERVIEQDPGFPLAYLGLAEAAHELGYEQEAVQTAQRAFQLSGRLGREERLLVEARFRQLAHDSSRAIDIYRSLWVFHPEDLEHGLRLLRAQIEAGLGAQARATAAALRALPAPRGDDPRIDAWEAEACSLSGDHSGAMEIAARAAEKASHLGSPSLLARAAEIEGSALHRLGRPNDAVNRFGEALTSFRIQKNAGGEARCLQRLGVVLREQGEIEQAHNRFEAGLEIARQIGCKRTEAGLLANLSVLALGRRDFETAVSLVEEALEIQRTVGDRRGQAHSLNTLMAAYRGSGDSARLHRALDEGIALARSVDNFEMLARLLSNRVIVLSKAGDLSQARGSMEEARSLLPRIENQNVASVVHSSIAQYEVLQGNLAAAVHGYAEAVRLSRAGGNQQHLAVHLTSLAWAQLMVGGLVPARDTLVEGLTLAGKMDATRTRALLLQVFADLSVTEGALDEARQQIEESISLFETNNETWNLGESYLAAAHIAFERGEFSRSEDLIATAIRWNLELCESETEALSRAFRSRILLALDRAGEAESEIARAREILARQANRQRLSDIQVGLNATRVQLALGRKAEARRTVESALSKATETGFVVLEFEARLLLGEVILAEGGRESGRAIIESLAEEASLRGHRRISDAARRLLENQ